MLYQSNSPVYQQEWTTAPKLNNNNSSSNIQHRSIASGTHLVNLFRHGGGGPHPVGRLVDVHHGRVEVRWGPHPSSSSRLEARPKIVATKVKVVVAAGAQVAVLMLVVEEPRLLKIVLR